MRKQKKNAYERIYCRYIKRMMDVFFSICLLCFLWLPMIVISVLIRADSRGKAIFKQERVGKDGKRFVCYKFRSMYSGSPSNMAARDFSDAEKYITRVGRVLRRTSLDELPQLFNVIRGDMSIVGPRPLICEEEDAHIKRMKAGVYNIRPGITGMAQISGRNLLANDEKVQKDNYYLQNVTAVLDAKIVFRTIFRVADGTGLAARSEDISNQ